MAENKSQGCEVGQALLAAEAGDVLELDEVWTFVRRRVDQRWLGYRLRRYGASHSALCTALCRRTRQIVAWVSGDHSAKTCGKLWGLIPEDYRACHSFSDCCDAYAKVFPKETHRSGGKGSGETGHMERWNCTLPQKMARFTRETFSFSKPDPMHQVALKCFIHDYNLTRISIS